MNVIEFIRFCAMLIIAGTLFRLIELHYAGKPGVLGTAANGLGVIF